ncbi:MAG: SMC-Scp complex subunit ScpB [Pirellulales bacterium]|nr:SMC-Scp complex subunit ScpB [Pirellulales bacterium]
MSQAETAADDPQGRFSLHGLSAAFARLTGSGNTELSQPEIADALQELQNPGLNHDAVGEVLSPRMIVEGMLFVGNSTGGLLTNRQMAANIRDVSPAEIDELIGELNELYEQTGAPYEIVSVGAGYRMQIRQEFDAIRQRFYGRVREAKLTPPAIEVLSIVAYRQGISAEDVSNLRGMQSRGLLNQLVRRGLLSIERHEASPKKPTYYTTDRFNRLFKLASPQDLPSSEDLDDK